MQKIVICEALIVTLKALRMEGVLKIHDSCDCDELAYLTQKPTQFEHLAITSHEFCRKEEESVCRVKAIEL